MLALRRLVGKVGVGGIVEGAENRVSGRGKWGGRRSAWY